MTREMRVPVYALDRPTRDPIRHRELAHAELQSGVANAIVQFSWAELSAREMQRAVLVTVGRMLLWSVDPEQAARLDAQIFGSDVEVRRGDD